MPMYNMFFRRALPAIALLCSLWACNFSDFEDVELVDHEADYAFPLFQTSINLKDLMDQVLNDTLSGDSIIVNPDGTMTLIYTGDLVSKPATDLFNFFMDAPILVQDTVFEADFNAPNSLRVDQIDFTGGTLQTVVTNNLNDTVDFTVTIPQLTKNGVPYQVKYRLNKKETYISPLEDMGGYELRAQNNKLRVVYEAYLPNGTRVRLPDIIQGSLPAVLIPTKGLVFSYMEGYWGYETYPLTEDTIEIDINQTDLEGNVTVTDPKVTFTVANSWGFPTRLLVEKLVFVDKNGVEIALQSTVLDNGALDLDYPSLIDGEVGQTKYTDVFFDKNNSNIDDIFNSQPVQLIYDIDGIANVDQDPSITGFITDSSLVTLLVGVELLLEGSALNFGADQTVDLDFGDFETLDTAKIAGVEFKLVTENETPISADLQVFFLDDNEQVLDSLFVGGAQTMLRAAPIDNNGIAIGMERTETFIPMSTLRFNRIRTATKAQLLTYFTTAQGGQVPVKLLATQDAAVKMGIRVKAKL